MSEIRSISTGSYTIGQTSNLNFEAGPGIKITEPSEGTVRIANDETVLWETSGYGTTSGTFSENYKNFDRVKIWTINNDQQTNAIDIITANQGATFSISTKFCNGTNTQWCKDSTFNLTNSGFSLRGAVSYQLVTNGIASVSFSSDSPVNSILKIIGINRIAGGSNE